jgi:hypothetical protein
MFVERYRSQFMLTRDTAIQVSFEGYALLRQSKDNSPALRRFLSRWSHEGMVLQVFSDFGQDLNAAQLVQFQAYAEQVRLACMDLLSEADPDQCCTTVQAQYSIVQNTYPLSCDIETATLPELRKATVNLLVLSDGLHAFAVSPHAELESVRYDASTQELLPLHDVQELQRQSAVDFVLSQLTSQESEGIELA